MSGLRYVYAICRPFTAAPQAQLTGVAGVPPKLLHHGDLVAVVGEVPEGDFAEEPLRAHLADLDWLRETARAHQRVIDTFTAVCSPLPLRFATVFRDDSGVRVMMEERRDQFLRTLERLDGRVEWGVTVYAADSVGGEHRSPEGIPEKAATGHEDATGRDDVTGGDDAAGPDDVTGRDDVTRHDDATGRDDLRQRRMRNRAHEDRWERAETFARELHDALSACAEETRIHAPRNAPLSPAPSGHNVLNAAYLVPRAESERFVELVERTKDAVPGLRVELTGPWAAYSFSGEGS